MTCRMTGRMTGRMTYRKTYRKTYRMTAAIGVTAGAVLLLAAPPARAELTVDHEGGSGGCLEAASYFPEDQSREATRARQRCRLETFEQRMENDRLQKEIQSDADHDKLLQTWIDKQEIPARVFRRVYIDGYLGGGVTTYGLATGLVILPWLEAELSLGRRDVNEGITNGYLQDSRTCWGGRLKWLMRGRGNLTPFAALGIQFCDANVALTTYNVSAPTGILLPPGGTYIGGQGSSNGSAVAHVVAGAAGLTWTDKSGFRASAEYTFAYAFYTQATLDDMSHTEDATLNGAWTDRLATERNGFRIQVGYAF